MADGAPQAVVIAVDAPPAPPAPPVAVGARHEPVQGAVFLVLGIAVFSLQDLVIKLVSGAYPLSEALTIRSVTALPLLLVLVAVDGGLAGLRSRRWRLLVLRGAVMCVAYTCYYLALAALPLATCVALYFTAPLFITVLSVFALGETVGPRRLAAVLVGFAGMLIMVRPGSELFDWAALLPVVSGLAYGTSQIIARRLGETERSTVMAFYGNALFLVAGVALAGLFGNGALADESHPSLAFLMRGWSVPGAWDLLLMMSCGVVAAVGLTLLTQAYRMAHANVVASFEYTALIWGVLYGWLIWGQLPRSGTWLGIAVVVGAGLYVLHRERRLGRPTLWRRAGWRRLRQRRSERRAAASTRRPRPQG